MWRGRRAQEELAQDIRDHLQQEIDDNVALGMPAEEARRQALLTFGNVARVIEDTRAVWSWVWLEQLGQDTRYAFRSLTRSVGLTAAVVITLGLGIGVNTAMFSMLDAVMLTRLPVRDSQEIVALSENAPQAVPDTVGGMGRYLRFSYPRYVRLQSALGAHGSLVAMTVTNIFTVRLAGRAPTSAGVQLVSGNYFAMLGVAAARGRVLTDADAGPASSAVAVVSDAFWKREMGAAEGVVGQMLAVNGVPFTVAGVASAGFTGAWVDDNPDVWVPLTTQSALQYQNNVSSYGPVDASQPFVGQDQIAWLNLIGRISAAERQSAERLLQDADRHGIAEFAIAATSDPRGQAAFLAQTLAIEPLAHGFSRIRARQSGMLRALMGMVALILVLTAANVANLLLVRAGRRGREMAVRVALGASTGRIVRHLLSETLVLAMLGGLAGVLAGGWSRHFLAREIVGTSRLLPDGFSLDRRTLLFACLVSLTTAIVFGLVPAFRAARAGGMAAAGLNGRQALGPAAMRGMRPLVVLQLALSVVIVFAATLLGRSVMNLARVEPGFGVERLVSASFNIRRLGYSPARTDAMLDRLVATADSAPGATSAAVSVCGLLAGCSYTTSVKIKGPDSTVGIYQNWVSPEYFATIGLPLVRGRVFDSGDTEHGPAVAVVTDAMARRYFAGDPVGRHFTERVGSREQETEIVGVVQDLRAVSLRDTPVAMVFYPLSRRGTAAPSALDVRVAGDPDRAIETVRQALKRAEPGLTFNVTSMPLRLAQQVDRDRAVAYLTAGFAGLALLIAAVGLYGVLAHLVAQRHLEIGVRLALGAQRSQVLALIARQGALLAGAGLIIGLVAAPLVTRSLQGMFFEVTMLDPRTFICVAGIMLAVAGVASIVPARRATKVDPMVSLRAD
jgi:predicted permease